VRSAGIKHTVLKMKKLFLVLLLCITAYFSNAQLVLRINKYLVDSADGGISYLWFDTSYNPTGQGHWKNIGSGSGGGGSIILAGQNYLSLAGGTLTANAVNLSGTNVTGTLAEARFPALTGAISNSAGSLTTTLNSSSVTTITDPLYIKTSGTSILTGDVNIATNTRYFQLNDTTGGNATIWKFQNGEITYDGTDGASSIEFTASPTNGFYSEHRDSEGNFGFSEISAAYSNLEYRNKHGTTTGLLNYYANNNGVSPYSLLAAGEPYMGVWMDSTAVKLGFGASANDRDLKGIQISHARMHIQPPVGKLIIDSLNRITSITDYQFLVRHAGNDTVKAISPSDAGFVTAETDPVVKAINGIVKSNGTTISAAVAGTDYEAALGNPSTNGYILSSTTAGVRSWIAPSGVTDGDKGDIVVSSSGTVWDIDAGVIVNADINASAAIAYSKLNLTGAILNADIVSLAFSKLTSVPDAVADGSTKGIASFTAADFNASSGNISLDYTNAQKATTSTIGFLTDTDWDTFNDKQAALVSGTNIKTINGSTILGSGDLAITASAAGSHTNIQYNGSGSLAGSNDFIFDGTKVSILSAATNNSTLKVGTLELQPYSLNNAWFGENVYYDGAGNFKHRATGGAGLFYFQGDEGQFRFYASAAAGTNETTYPVQLKVNYTGTVAFGGTISAANNDYSGATAVAYPTTLLINNFITSAEVAAPSTPASGFAAMYVKSDGLWYGKDDAGVETMLSNIGGSGLTVGTTTVASGSGGVLYDNGGTLGQIAKATAATASTLVQRDADANVTANNWLGGYATTATAAGTTTLTVGSSYLQYFTGATTQTVTLPVATTLTLGHQFVIVNNSTGNVTINSSGGNAVVVLAGGTSTVVTCILASGTTAASWAQSYSAASFASGKKVVQNNSITYSGTDGTTMTFPTTTATIARTDAAQTFTGSQTFSQVLTTNNAIAAVANAATVPITSAISTVTNNSAATLTITLTTASAIDGQMVTVRVLDFSGVAQTITWVNTENSSVAAPTTSNGSTTLFLTVRFIYNSATSKWRCIGYA
jgi:hypothetical protein